MGSNDYSSDANGTIGTGNLEIGNGAGGNYSTGESSNIDIGSAGFTNENNALHIGDNIDDAYIGGIWNNPDNTDSTPMVVTIDDLGHLGSVDSSTLTGATGPTGPAGSDGTDGSDGAVGATGPAGSDSTVAGPTRILPAVTAQRWAQQAPAGSDSAVATGPAGSDGATGPTGPAGSDGSATFVVGSNDYTSDANGAIGSGNIEIGNSAGGSYSTTESGNIDIGSVGNPGEFDTLHIGDGISNAYIGGIWNNATNNNSTPFVVTVDNEGHLGSVDSSTLTGATGPTGPAGSDGTDGSDGAVGATGPAGSDSTVAGPTGPAGSDGAVGATGPAGSDSTVAGPTGPAGSDGSTTFVVGTNDHTSDALSSISTGADNTAVGNDALGTISTGIANIGIGVGAGSAYSGTESENIVIGGSGHSGASAEIVIGSSQTKTYIAGIIGVTTDADDAVPVLVSSQGQLGITSSSQRFKKDIQDMGSQSEALLALRPVSFRYKQEQKNGVEHYGLIAEEVAKINQDLVVHDKDGQILTVRYDAVNAMLLNEFQKQHEEVVTQQKTIADLRARVATLTAEQKEIADLKAQFEALKKSVSK